MSHSTTSYVTAIGTANPPFRLSQDQFLQFYSESLGFDAYEHRRLRALYHATRINTRYTAVADFTRARGDFTFFANTDDFRPVPTTDDRMQLFREQALPTAAEAVRRCLAARADTGGVPRIDYLITVSCTGMYAPGLDVELIEHFDLPTDTPRANINFMGCFAAFNALRLADALCRAHAGYRVLIVNVELPSLHFQHQREPEFLVSNGLFGDGATAMLVERTPRPDGLSLGLCGFHSAVSLRGKADMVWQIRNAGFEVLLSEYIPMIVKGDVRDVVERALGKAGLTREQVDYFAFHPGGRAILEAVESQVGLSPHDNRFAYDVLRDFGNMSSCTVIFVLQRIAEQLTAADAGKTILGCTFGPGLSIETAVFSVTAT